MKRSYLILLLLLIVTGATLSLATAYLAINYGKAKEDCQYGLFIVATQLPEKPQNYLTLDSPDGYVQQAISNPKEDVYVGAWENTQIDDLFAANHTNNIAVQNRYYHLDLLSGDPPALISTSLISWVTSGWIMWGCLTVLSAVVIRALKRRSHQASA